MAKTNIKLNQVALDRILKEAAAKVEKAFNADLLRLKAQRGEKTDDQVAVEIRSLARRHSVKLDAATVVRHSKAE